MFLYDAAMLRQDCAGAEALELEETAMTPHEGASFGGQKLRDDVELRRLLSSATPRCLLLVHLNAQPGRSGEAKKY